MDPGVGGGESSGGVVFICLPFKKNAYIHNENEIQADSYTA
jgi:hypothetical protein